MKNRFRQRSIAGILVVLLITVSMPIGQAAPKAKPKKPAQPISIEADDMYINDTTGELFAQGRVVVSQYKSRILANLVRGNTKETEIWTESDDKVQLLDPTTDLIGMKIHYNYGGQFGTMQSVAGKCGDSFVTGSSAHFENDKYTVYNATTTGCPAKGTPDYRVTAKRVEIWPNDRMIAYEAAFWIKNVIIYTTPVYERSLKEGEKDKTSPSFGYDNRDGFWVSQTFSFPIAERTSVDAQLDYYSIAGFKPIFTLSHNASFYNVRLTQGDFRDVNNRWIRKEPELTWSLIPKRIGKLPVTYTLSAVYGKWTDENQSSWHQDYSLYFTHDPIYFEKKKEWQLNLGTGVEQVRESVTGSIQNIFNFNTSLHKKISPNLSVWIGYNFTNNNNSVFEYNRVDVAQGALYGIYGKLGPKTDFGIYTNYDLTNKKTYDYYFSIRQNLHCWNLSVAYQPIAQKITWLLEVIRF